MIAERAHTGDVGVALATYLSEDDEIDESARIDVRRQLDSVYSRLAPDLMPAGRWVSPHELNVAAGKMAAAERTCELWFAAQRHHHAVRPTFLDLILSWGRKHREWNDHDQKLTRNVHSVTFAVNECRRVHCALKTQLDSAARAAQAARHELATLDGDIFRLRDKVERYQRRWGRYAMDSSWRRDVRRRELDTLWCEPDTNAARSELFVAALRLHNGLSRAHRKADARQLVRSHGSPHR
jgi:hypothetical protein